MKPRTKQLDVKMSFHNVSREDFDKLAGTELERHPDWQPGYVYWEKTIVLPTAGIEITLFTDESPVPSQQAAAVDALADAQAQLAAIIS